MKTAARLFFAVLFFAFVFCSARGAFAATVEIVEYQCKICGKSFYSIKGDDLQDKKFHDEKEQLSNVYRLTERGKPLEECKGFKGHIFLKKSERREHVNFIHKNRDRFAALKSGGSLNNMLKEWKCFMCKKTFYSLGKEDLNIKEWDEQQSNIFNLKSGAPIYKCDPKYQGHVFEERAEGSCTSNEVATAVHNLYWVK